MATQEEQIRRMCRQRRSDQLSSINQKGAISE